MAVTLYNTDFAVNSFQWIYFLSKKSLRWKLLTAESVKRCCCFEFFQWYSDVKGAIPQCRNTPLHVYPWLDTTILGEPSFQMELSAFSNGNDGILYKKTVTVPHSKVPFIQKCPANSTSVFNWALQPRAASCLHAGVCPRAVTVKYIWDTKPLMMRGCWGKAGTLTFLLNSDGFWTTLTPLDSLVHLGQITHMVLFIWPVRDSGIIGPPCFFSFFCSFSPGLNSNWYALLEGIHCVVCAHMKAVVCLQDTKWLGFGKHCHHG